MWFGLYSTVSLSRRRAEPVRSASIGPGATALTLMPYSASSRATSRMKPWTPALACHRVGDEAGRRRLVGDVTDHAERLAARGGDVAHRPVQAGCVDVAQRHARALLGEAQRDRATEPAGRSGHHRHLILYAAHGILLGAEW